MANIWDEYERDLFSGKNKKDEKSASSNIWDDLEQEHFNPKAKAGLTASQFSSSIDRYQAGLYGVGEAVAEGVGARDSAEWLKGRREENEFLADKASQRARDLGAVDQFKDVHSLSDFGSYAKGLAIQSLPYAGEALAGGLLARGAMSGTRAALTAAKEAKDVAGVARAERALNAGSQAGAVAASYPSAVGDVLGNQREQSDGETRGGVAAALAVPYAALNAFGVEGALARGTAFKNTVNLLDRGTGLSGAAARTAATATGVALKEGASETGQEMLNQVGRMSVDSSEAFLSEAAQERFKESFIGGAALGGLAGGLGGGWRRSSAGGNDISQAMGSKDATQPDITTTQFTPPPPPPAADITGTPSVVSTQQTIPSAPAVVGGTTDIAQAQAQAQAAQQQQQMQEQQQAAREEFTQRFGGVRPALDENGQPTQSVVFQNKTYHTRDELNAAVDKLVAKDQTKDDHARQVQAAFTKTYSTQEKTPNVNSVVSQTSRYTNRTASVEEAAARINIEIATLVGQGKKLDDTKLSKLAEFYENLTGVTAPAYAAAEQAQPTGVNNGKLQLQNDAGLREVPVTGGATETNDGQAGGVRPAVLQSVGATSVGAGPSDVQAGQPSTGGVRTSAGNVPNAVGGDVTQAQVSEATNGQATTESGQAAVQPTSSEETVPSVQQTGKPARAAEEVKSDEELLADQAEDITAEVMEILIPVHQRMTGKDQQERAETAQRLRDFTFSILMNGHYDTLAVMAKDFKIKLHQAKDWSAKALAFKADPEYLQKLKGAYEVAAAKRGLTIPELLSRITAKARTAINDKMEVDRSISTSREQGGPRDSDERKLNLGFDAEGRDASDIESNEGLSIKSRKSGESIQERFNAVDTNQAKVVRLMQDLGNAETAVEKIEQQLDSIKNAPTNTQEFTDARVAGAMSKYEAALVKGEPASRDALYVLAYDAMQKGNRGEASMYLEELEKIHAEKIALAASLEAELKAKQTLAEEQAKKQTNKSADLNKPEKETKNAVQKPSPKKVPVQERTGGSEALGEGDAEGGKAAREVEQAKAEQEEVKTPKEQYEALAATTNLLPPYEALDERERAQIEDQAYQGKLTLASLNTMFSGNAKFGKDVRAINPYTVAELTKDIEDFVRASISSRKLVIVNSVEDLTNSADKVVKQIGAVLAVEGAYGVAVNGRAFLIANRIEKGMGRAKFMHEVGAHIGLENLLPKATYDRLVAQIKKWTNSEADTDEVTLAARAEMRVLNANTPAADYDAELLAYFIEEAVQAGIDPTASMQETGPLAQWFRTLWAAFKAAVRKLGFNPEALTAQDVVDMAFGAAQLELATDTDTKSKTPKFGFAGVKAVGAATEERQAGLMSAQMDLANGKDPKEIWDETGWYKGTDGQWRFEFDDTNAQFKGALEGKKFSDIARMEESTLGEILEHEELFRNYPELRDVKFEVRNIPMDFQRATQGWFDAKLNKLFVTPYAIDPLSTVLHEVQHWIQSKEGFENGANPSGSDLSNKVALRKLRAELVAHIDRAAELEADRVAAIREGRYRSTFDEALRGFKARDLLPAVDTLLAQSSELAPKYAKLRELDTEIDRLEKAKTVLTQKHKEENKKAGLLGKVKNYTEQTRDLRIYTDKLKARTAERDAVNAEIAAVVNNIAGGKAVAHEIYRLVSGEAEARNTQRRQKMTAAERKASFPESTMDVRPENTIRAIGRDGTYLSTERMRFGKEAAQPTGVFSKAGEWLDAAITSPKETLQKLKLGFLTLDQLAELDKSPSQVVRAYSNVMTAMQKTSKDLVYKAAQIDQLWAKLTLKDSENLSKVMRDSTRAKFDPSLGVAGTNETEDGIMAAYRALTPSAKDVYAKAKKYYEDAFATRLAIMEESAAKLGGKELKEIQQLYSKLKGPYFPLGRTGSYYAVGMSPRVAELTAKKEATGLSSSETTELATLRKQADQYKTSSFDTLYDAKKAAEKFKKEMGDSYYNEVEVNIESTMSKMPNFAKIEESITTQLGGETRAEVKSMLAKLMFDSLPEQHALKNQMRREGIYGENEDMRQVFAQTSISQAHYISRLQFGGELNNAMLAIGKAARKDIEMRQIQNELKMRTKLSMDNTQSALTDAMVNASYFAHLGLSPAFLLTNMTQVPMITAPWLGARHGVGATKRAMAMALADTAKIIKSSFKDGDWRSEIDWNNLFPAGSNEDRMFRDLLDRNVLDITMEHDLAAVASAQRGLFDDKIFKVTGGNLGGMSDVIKLVNTPVRITELANRAVTALSAYRLKLESLKSAPMTAEERHTAAVDYAARAVSETQLNYSELNAPRHMRQVFGSKPLAKMIFQFRKYQQGMLYLIAKNISDALPNSKATKEDRRIARRTIAGLYMTTGLMAGTTGMPLMGTVGLAGMLNLIAAAFGDEDEPWDAEVEYRNFLNDWLGKDMALLVAKGLPAYLGADLSQRVGMGDIANPIPFVQRGATGQSTVANVLYAAGGAPVGMAGTMYDGIVAMANGDVMKGMEKVIPVKAVKDALRTYRYTDEGMTDKRGNVILAPEKFDAWDLTLRGMGFAPTKESEYYAANAAMQGAKTAATDVRTRLLREYSEAKLKGESTEDVDAKISDFNERHPEKTVKIDMSTKLKAVQARRKMAAERTESGLRIGKNEKPFADEARFATQE